MKQFGLPTDHDASRYMRHLGRFMFIIGALALVTLAGFLGNLAASLPSI